MMTGTYLQVWLDAETHANHTTLVPYVKSTGPMQIRYNIALVRRGNSGSSLVRQAGHVELAPGKATALATLSSSVEPPDICEVSITLQENDKLIGQYRFDCAD